MKKFITVLAIIFAFTAPTFAAGYIENFNLDDITQVQDRINKVGFRILNSNRLEQRVCFRYLPRQKEYNVGTDLKFLYLQRIVYVTPLQMANIGDDNELAALLSRRIAQAVDSYDGIFRGYGSLLDYWVKPQKYNNKADKEAVDYMVAAGYNPLALIVHICKSTPQRRYECGDSYSLSSRRMARIYEYIYNKYPSFLATNYYSDNIYYQNFLLTSRANRAKLQQKIETKSTKKVRYK